jgi:hypothetical protein
MPYQSPMKTAQSQAPGSAHVISSSSSPSPPQSPAPSKGVTRKLPKLEKHFPRTPRVYSSLHPCRDNDATVSIPAETPTRPSYRIPLCPVPSPPRLLSSLPSLLRTHIFSFFKPAAQPARPHIAHHPFASLSLSLSPLKPLSQPQPRSKKPTFSQAQKQQGFLGSGNQKREGRKKQKEKGGGGKAESGSLVARSLFARIGRGGE